MFLKLCGRLSIYVEYAAVYSFGYVLGAKMTNRRKIMPILLMYLQITLNMLNIVIWLVRLMNIVPHEVNLLQIRLILAILTKNNF